MPSPLSPIHRVVLILVFALASGCATVDEGATAPAHAGSLVLVSFDGFRWDYDQLTDTPTLDRMAREGLKAEALQSAFPTVTFPNHFSIATGVLPWRHGIVANDFPNGEGDAWYSLKDRDTVQDGSWYLAEPVWVTAEKAGMRTAAFYFVGTEADIGGIRPSDWRPFDASVPNEARVAQVLEWLSTPGDTRPRLVTLYFEEVDEHAHRYGPGSGENRSAIRELDRQLGELLGGIATLPHGDNVHVILVSDHGQGEYDAQHPPLILDEWVNLEGTKVVNGGPYAFVHILEAGTGRADAMRDVINRNWDCGRAYLPNELPRAWNAGSSDRYPDLFVMADRGCAVFESREKKNGVTPGSHGWPPDVPEMRGIFYAVGPRVPVGARPGVVHVTDVYPMMLDILGLEAPGPVDGDPAALAGWLLPEKE